MHLTESRYIRQSFDDSGATVNRQQIPRWAKKEHMLAQHHHQSGETTLMGKLLGRYEDELYADELTYMKTLSDSYTSGKPPKRLALDPRSAMRCRWDMVIILCVAWTCFILPMRVGFGDEEIGPMTIADLMVDVIFFIDIFVNFCTGYFVFDDESQELKVERRYKQSALHYIKTWFVFDLIATVPVDFLVTQLTPEPIGRTAVYVRITRALRLFRLHRMFRYLKTWQELIRVPSHYMRMGKLCFLIVVFAHFDACVIFFASQLEEFPEQSWVIQHDVINMSKGKQYLYSLFIALSHMLCIGYGPAGTPGTMLELLVTTVSMLVGMITSSLMTEDALDRVASSDLDLEEINDVAKYVAMPPAPDMNRLRQSDLILANLVSRRATSQMEGEEAGAEEAEKLRPVVDVLAGIMARATKSRAGTARHATDFRFAPKLKQVMQRRVTALQAQRLLALASSIDLPETTAGSPTYSIASAPQYQRASVTSIASSSAPVAPG
eukprot:jgi/Tetstr1/436777/TSEL_025557.t1